MNYLIEIDRSTSIMPLYGDERIGRIGSIVGYARCRVVRYKSRF